MEDVLRIYRMGWSFSAPFRCVLRGALPALLVSALYLFSLGTEASVHEAKEKVVETGGMIKSISPLLPEDLVKTVPKPQVIGARQITGGLSDDGMKIEEADSSYDVLYTWEPTYPESLPKEEMASPSVPDGAEMEESEGVTVPVIRVTLLGNGGYPECTELERDTLLSGEEELDIPKRLGKAFTGWYTDASCTIPFTGMEEGSTEITLYAGWKEFKGYVSDENGYIIGYTDENHAALDGLIVLPTHESCVGVTAGAFCGLEDVVFEIYVPANITYIDVEAFSDFVHLMYVKVSEENPVYCDENGVLCTLDGTVILYPKGREEM